MFLVMGCHRKGPAQIVTQAQNTSFIFSKFSLFYFFNGQNGKFYLFLTLLRY